MKTYTSSAEHFVLITGASRGIGRACALLFARMGWHIFLNCRRSFLELQEVEKKIQSETPGSCTILPGDVGNPEDVRQIFDAIYQICPCLDVLINNAGIAHIGLLQDMSIEQWDRLLKTNLTAVFLCCRRAIPGMVKKQAGKILNISSVWGVCGASCEAAYSASKGGVNAMTRALAKELAPSHIQVNAVACGAIDTEMNGFLDAEEKEMLLEEIPAGRMGTPEEAAALLLKLAEAPEYLTGQVIGLDGGWI